MTTQLLLQSLYPLLIVLGIIGVVYFFVSTRRFDSEDEIEIIDPQGHKLRVKLTPKMTSAEKDAVIQEKVRKLLAM